MPGYPKISIVTPSFNDVLYIEATILSVVDQGYPNLEYIVIDGGSTDGSLDIIRKYEEKISHWVSEPDQGMYHAIQKGFEKSTGEIMGWINSDDQHQPGSLFTIAQIFSDFQGVHWLQGTPTVIDERGRIFTDPHRFDVDKFFFYQKRHARTHKFIQQESTFWRRSLWIKAGQHISTQYKFAGDFELWIRFFQHERLYHVNAILGSFRQTSGTQASIDHLAEYVGETFSILHQHPLSRKEKIQLRYLVLLESVYMKISAWYFALRRKFKTPTILQNALYFEPREQKIKKW